MTLNANGIQDAGEPGIEASPSSSSTAPASPRAPHHQCRRALCLHQPHPGDYYLTFTPPAGFVFSPQNAGGDDTVDSDANTTTGTTATTTLTSGENDISWDAGLYPRASLGDFVWNDTNANGIQDAGEPGIKNVTVTCTPPALPLATTTTNANGLYTFTGLTPGSYSVQFVNPGGYASAPRTWE